MAQGANRVVIGLPDRYEKAKTAVRDLEGKLRESDDKLARIHQIVATRNLKGFQAKDLLDAIRKIIDE